MSNTGADTVEELRGHATKIYLSHRHGSYVVSTSMFLVDLCE